MENVMVPRSLVERIEAILKCHAEYGMDHIFEETGDKTPNAILCEEIVTQLKTLAATTTVEQEPVAWVSKRGMSWLERKHPSTIEPVGAVASEVNCIPLYDHPYPPADKQAAQEGETPRTDAHLQHLNLPNGGKIGIPNETVELLCQLEREAYQIRMDACDDSKRLIDDKMKLFERVTDLERELSTTPRDIFEKCARICEALACPDSVDEFRDGVWRCAPGYDYFREAAEAIRAEALKVSAEKGRG